MAIPSHGSIPIPTTTKSHGTDSSPTWTAVTRFGPSIRPTFAFSLNETPSSSNRDCIQRDSSGVSALPHTRSVLSMTADATPRPASEAASSIPTKPAPTSTAREAPTTASRIASASSTERSVNTPSRSVPGTSSRLARPPVASRMRGAPKTLPREVVTVMEAGSSTMAFCRVTSCTFACSPNHPSGFTYSSERGTSGYWMNSFDRGGL